MGGGGYLDPLERDPARVAADVANLVVTEPEARRRYGVVLTADGVVDEPATAAAREAIRVERRATAAVPDPSRFATSESVER